MRIVIAVKKAFFLSERSLHKHLNVVARHILREAEFLAALHCEHRTHGYILPLIVFAGFVFGKKFNDF